MFMKAINNNYDNEVAIKTFIFYCKKRKEYTQEILLLIKESSWTPRITVKLDKLQLGDHHES